MRLTIPCRAVTCTHLQCFDAALYLQMNEKKPTWICPVCDKKAAYDSLILDGLFMEILNQCTDVDEIQFQEDGSWCPMRPKKEPLTTSSSQYSHLEGSGSLNKLYTVIDSSESSNQKKAEVIDLTFDSSSDEEEEPPSKKKCVYIPESQGNAIKGVVTYQPSTIRMTKGTPMEPDSVHPGAMGYSDPFHHSAISGISTDLPGLDFLSLVPADSQSQLGTPGQPHSWQKQNLEQPP